MPIRILPYGPDAFLVRYAAPGDAAAAARAEALARHLDVHPPSGLVEATPGFTTLLLEFEPGARPESGALAVSLDAVLRNAVEAPGAVRAVELPVVYDGPDLRRVAEHAGMGVDEVVGLHSGSVYRVRLLGFAPGFAYLEGLDPRLHTPRLATPRTRVPAGSVAIGGEHAGVYPVATAGGWNLLGRTDRVLLDAVKAQAGRADAFELQPGDSVRFVPVARGDARTNGQRP